VEVRRWYHTARWRRLRQLVLSEEPLCVDCIKEDRIEASTDVDHEIPHRGDEELFWSRENLHGRCHSCHSRKTQRGE
jgi:5-methylcytosine-specific restriction protein A